jgi:hypothetical protein
LWLSDVGWVENKNKNKTQQQQQQQELTERADDLVLGLPSVAPPRKKMGGDLCC